MLKIQQPTGGNSQPAANTEHPPSKHAGIVPLALRSPAIVSYIFVIKIKFIRDQFCVL